MYPMPEQFKVNPWEVIKGAALEGFKIFNEIKGMIPGEMQDKIIAGLPKGLVGKADTAMKTFNQAKGIFDAFAGGDKQEFEDFEEMFEDEDLTEMKFLGGESKADFQKRIALRNKYVAQCNSEKKVFASVIGKHTATLKKLA